MDLKIKNAKNLRRRKFYTPPVSETKWQVIKTQVVGDNLHMLCREEQDYVVFSFWLLAKDLKKHCPSDKFTGGARRGAALFKEIVSHG